MLTIHEFLPLDLSTNLVGRGGMPTATTVENDLPSSKEVMALLPNRLVSGENVRME